MGCTPQGNSTLSIKENAQNMLVGFLARKFRSLEYYITWRWAKYLFILPALCFVVIFLAYPILYGIYLSFTDYSLLEPNGHSFVGIKNYLTFMKNDSLFRISLLHSSVLTGSAVTLQLLLGIGFALALNQKLPGIRFFRSVAMVTWVIPIAATVILFKWMVTPNYGFINQILIKLGLEEYNTYWFGNPSWALYLILIMHVWRNVPFYGIAILASMQAIPQTLYEAAKVDGASPLQQFLYVTLPGIRYTALIMVILHVIFTFNNFDFVYLSTGGGPVNATEVLPTYVYEQSWLYYALGYASSIGVFMMLVLVVITLISLKVTSKW